MCDTTESDATRGDEAFAGSHDSRGNFITQSLSRCRTISESNASAGRVVAGLFCYQSGGRPGACTCIYHGGQGKIIENLVLGFRCQGLPKGGMIVSQRLS